MIVIQKNVLSKARIALKKNLKDNYEDEPLENPMGPPSVSFDPGQHGIKPHCMDKFWEVMLKEMVVVRHPYGGYMHPRFQFSNHPSVAEIKKRVLSELGHVLDPNDEL